MNIREFKQALRDYPQLHVRFRLPDGTLSALHAHITEVGLVTKAFIDCGGTVRSEEKCQLQSWVADDLEHRLSAGKLLSILEKGAHLFASEELPVELEHDVGFISQFQLSAADAVDDDLVFSLVGKHTACLAPDKCCPPSLPVQQVVSLGRKT